MNWNEIPIVELNYAFNNKQLDPVEWAESYIKFLNRSGDKFNAWVCTKFENLMLSAEKTKKKINQGEKVNVFSGIPIGVKDIFNTYDFPTQMGSVLWKDFTPGNDARVVSALRNNDAAIIGKTITAEFAVHELNQTLNPHDISRTPGTSSSGSAVSVAVGHVPFSLGSQSAGSIIRPASFCGIYGYKPSFGLVPRTGSLKTSDSLDTVGMFVKNPVDLEAALRTVTVKGPNYPFIHKARQDPSRINKSSERPWRIGFLVEDEWDYVPSYALDAISKFKINLQKDKNFHVKDVPWLKFLKNAHDVHNLIYTKSLSYYFENEFQNPENMSKIMHDMIAKGKNITIEQYHSALNEQNIMIKMLDNFFHNFDFLCCLSTSGDAPKRGVMEKPDTSLVWTLTHVPTLSVPMFISPNDNPYGLQVVGRKYNDELLINFTIDMLRLGLFPSSSNPRLDI